LAAVTLVAVTLAAFFAAVFDLATTFATALDARDDWAVWAVPARVPLRARFSGAADFRAEEEEAGIAPFLNRRPSLMCG
jgi:hypothetical protein